MLVLMLAVCRLLLSAESTAAAEGRVVVHRLDDGGYKEPGTYVCTACGLRMEHKHRDTASKHVSKKHDGRGIKLVRLISRPPPSKDKMQEQNREKQRRHAAKRKVCTCHPRAAAIH